MKSFVSKEFVKKYGGGVVHALVKGMLTSKLVDQVLAFASGLDQTDVVPNFFYNGQDAERMVISSHYPLSLARLLRDYLAEAEGVGLVVRSCDARAIIELAKRGQVNRDHIYLIGIECYGVSDIQQGQEEELYILPDERDEVIHANCRRCEYPVPTMADLSCRLDKEMTNIVINSQKGREILAACSDITPIEKEVKRETEIVVKRASKWQERDFGELRKMTLQERLNYWFSQFDKCIKCYGCRNSCPLCYCKDCYLGADRPLVNPGQIPPERLFHLARLAHVADSCVNCGQCEAACPMQIPISKLYHMLYKELSPAFKYESGTDLNAPPPLGTITEEELGMEGVDLD